jgi:hypothetical protein
MYKRLICLVFFVFALGLDGNASADLIGHWKFDEFFGNVAADSSGNDYNGTLYGGPTWIPGQNFAALRFDGINDYVGTGVSLLNNISDFSMTGWVSARNPGDSRIGLFGQNDLIEMGFDGGNIAVWTAASDATSTVWIFPNDTWHHVAIVAKGTDMMIYLDGELAATGAGANNYGTSSYPFNIGGGGVWDESGNWFSGAIDDVRVYNHALSEAEIHETMEIRGWPYAGNPNPADGALYTETWASMSWVPGAYAVSHNIYLGESFDDVYNGTSETFLGNQISPYFVVGFPGYPYPDGLVPGTTYYWRIDEVNDADKNSPWRGDVWSFTVPFLKAYDPVPADGANFLFTNVELSWSKGLNSELHYLYFGETFEEVQAATGGILVNSTSYTPTGLEHGKTYYWRIDESDGFNTYTGDVWSFTMLPEIPVSDPNLVGWWKLDEGTGLTAVDWSGHGHHGTFQGDPQWVTGYDGGAVEFDGDDYIDTGYTENLATWTITCWVISPEAPANGAASGPLHREQNYQLNWNHPDATYRGAAAMNVGDTWYAASFMPLNANEWYHLAATYDGNELRAYRNGVLITTNSSPSGDPSPESNSLKLGRHAAAALFFTGIVDDARVYNRALTAEEIKQVIMGDPYAALNPKPANGSTPNINEAIPVTWSAGEKAAQHDVYFGTDRDAVDDADTTTEDIYRGRQASTSYIPPEGVEWSEPYYWRIDEYNTDGTISKGRIWSFTVADFILIDDFEEYNDSDNQIWYTWHDGLGYGAAGTPDYYAGNSSGSAVGDDATESFTEEIIIHGGKQSMPFTYDNNKQGRAKYSEVELPLTSWRDWTEESVAELSLWFRGYPVSVGSFVEGPVGTYTMTASGADIWRINGVEADEFHFAYKMLSGAGSITAKVVSIDNTDPWAKAGVMIRESLNPDSAHVFACVTPGNGVAMQYRPSTGGTSVNNNQTGVTAPYWVKLERSISGLFTVSQSANGTSWQPILGAMVENIPMNTNVYIGLALTAHDAALTCHAVFSSVTTTGNVTGQWADQDIGINSNDAEPLYVALSNSNGTSAVITNDDPAAAQVDTWTPWVIPLSVFSDQGIDLTNVDKLVIGLGTRGNMTVPGGSGKIFIDDIRLYRPAPEPEPEPEPQP